MLQAGVRLRGVTRARILVRGVVQGVGFRPFVHRAAVRLDLKGWVLNSTEGVVIEIEGPPDRIDLFLAELRQNPPPRAVIEKIETSLLPPVGYSAFIIEASHESSEEFVLISPDICICDDCLREIADPKDRRFSYPFTNCTNCGPRFTIIEDIPYDRPKTTMSSFRMCPICQNEYDDPANRRFHAQPNACPVCGPDVSLVNKDGKVLKGGYDAIAQARRELADGKILAVKGIGGFHLACNATDDKAVSLLRERKYRINKPFAIMSLNCLEISKYCHVNEGERQLLESPQRPIVLLQQKPDSSISPAVAPGNRCLGVMLAYTPLHYLLLENSGPDSGLLALVMTSGNMSEEPIAKDNLEALESLSKLADLFLLHNRDITVRCDDSVTRVFRDKEFLIRRSRGYAPFPVRLPFDTRQVLACGAQLKNTFCLTRDNYAFVSHHIGDLENVETLASFESGIEHFKHIFRVKPELIAYDMHPNYLSSSYALQLKHKSPGTRLVPVQHHHAHVASCMAENGLSSPVIGVALDGTGYGADGHVWGGEFLIADYKDFKRAGHLRYLPMPGGEAAIRKPFRMALSYLSYLPDKLVNTLPPGRQISPLEMGVLAVQIKERLNSPLTSSMGRLFDAVSSLLDICHVSTYEGQAALELEMKADPDTNDGYFWPVKVGKFPIIINWEYPLKSIIDDIRSKVPSAIISARFHNSVAGMIRNTCLTIKDMTGLNKVALSGGVFQNVFLLEKTLERLQERGFDVYIHHQVPCNDGGVSLGQAVVANAQYKAVL